MARPRRGGLLAEVVASLALVMFAATLVVAALLFHASESRLRDLLGRALLAEAHDAAATARGLGIVPGTVWWSLDPDGAVRGDGGRGAAIDPETRSLARDAHARGTSLLLPGAPWEPIRFAAPVSDGIRAARVPAAASLQLRAAPLALVAGLLVADVLLFTAFGVSLLRRRVVAPLQRLAAATRAMAEGGFEARLPIEGPREAADVAAAWNEMSEALSRRTEALEKAVTDLRAANTELRVTRSGLDRAQRLAAVGRLAAGVAHEVGNPLAAMLAFVDVAGRDPGLRDDTRAHLASAAKQGERVRKILRQLLEFSRPPRMECVPVKLLPLAEEAVGLVAAQRRYAGVRFEVACDADAPDAVADPAAAAQILLNLVLNAADAVLACGEGGAVRVQIRASVVDARGGEARTAVAARRGPDAVECVVADQGAGIADGDRERLFDPFFTTKPVGEGTGLGLANSLRLAEELSGALELVGPPEGFRTAFALRLPAAGHSASACAVRTGVRSASAGRESGPIDETQA